MGSNNCAQLAQGVFGGVAQTNVPVQITVPAGETPSKVSCGGCAAFLVTGMVVAVATQKSY